MAQMIMTATNDRLVATHIATITSKTGSELMGMSKAMLIEEAKRLGKRISFQYLTFDELGNKKIKLNGYRYIVSPYYSINSAGNYFLLCNYREKYRAISWFRIDYMVNVQIENDWPIKKLESLKGIKNFDVATFLNENIYLLEGKVIITKVRIDDHSYVQYVVEQFGKNAKIYKKDDFIYAEIKCNENALFYWYMKYSEAITIITPKTLIERVKKEAKRIIDKYE